MMKKILCFLSLLFLSLSFISCTKEENEIKDPTNNNDIEQDTKEIEFITINNLEDFYFLGEEGNLSITVYPNDVVINNIKYESSDDSIISIDNNGHLETKNFGKCIITITINDKEEKRIVEVVDSEEIESETTILDIQERLERQEELNEIAKEKGFDSWRDYVLYRYEQKRKENLNNLREKYEYEVSVSESLGITWEDYKCLETYGKTFDQMTESLKEFGYSLTVEYVEDMKYQIQLVSTNNDKRHILSIKMWFLKDKLDSFAYDDYSPYTFTDSDGKTKISYSNYYYQVTLFNNFGQSINQEEWEKIEEVLPNAEEYIRIYDYLSNRIINEHLYEGLYDYKNMTNELIRDFVCYQVVYFVDETINGRNPVKDMFIAEFRNLCLQLMEDYEK